MRRHNKYECMRPFVITLVVERIVGGFVRVEVCVGKFVKSLDSDKSAHRIELDNACVMIADRNCCFEACVDNGEYCRYYGIFEYRFKKPGIYRLKFRGNISNLQFRDVDAWCCYQYKKTNCGDDEFYEMKISKGRGDGFNFCERYYFATVEQWGDIPWRDMSYMFLNCRYLDICAQDVPDLSRVKAMEGMFCGAESMNADIGNWDVSNVRNMACLFKNCIFFNQPLDRWDTGNVTNMHGLFCGAHRFEQPIGSWDTGNVTDMSEMFSDAFGFNQPIGEWNTHNVTDMSYMFADAYCFNQPIGGWDTGNVRNMQAMLYDAQSFNQPIGGWNTGNVFDMSYMFEHAVSFNQPVESWNIRNVKFMVHTFAYALSFNQSLAGWKFDNMSSVLFSNVFVGAKSYSYPIYEWGRIRLIY